MTRTRSNHVTVPQVFDHFRLVVDDAVIVITRNELLDGICVALYRKGFLDIEEGTPLRSMKITYDEIERSTI